MKIVAINGSHRPGKSTSKLLQMALDDFAAQGWETELIELAHKEIDFCLGCNACLLKRPCPLYGRGNDQMNEIIDAINESDAVIVGSPNYFENVTARMKNFFDRTRPQHLAGNTMAGKISGIVCTTGLNNLGAEATKMTISKFCDGHGWITIGATQVVGSWDEGLDENGRTRYRKGAHLDPMAQKSVHHMTAQIMDLAKRIR